MASLWALLYCRQEYLEAVLETAVGQWGTWTSFVAEGLGLTDDRVATFRAALLH
jgi:hypothetical protein